MTFEHQLGRNSHIKLLFTYDREVYEITCCPSSFKVKTVLQKVEKHWAVIAFDELSFEAQLDVLEELGNLKLTYEEVNG